MSNVDVVGFGESSIDFVHVVPRLPDPAESKLRISSHFSSTGGQVATAMAACAALGLRASYLGPVGDDHKAARILADLEHAGVDVSRTIVRESASRFAVILVVEASGERCVLWSRDERLTLPPSQFTGDSLDGASALHVDGVDEAASIHAAGIGRSRGLLVTSDIDTVTDKTPDLLAAVDVPIFAQHVPAALTGESDIEQALRTIRRYHSGLLCVTLGERGSAALEGDRYHSVPAARVSAVDTTGAGDVFRGAMIYGLLRRVPTEDLLRFANTAAALSCTKSGALGAVPTMDEVKAALA